ncbi:MAG: bifunctional folylpolyglutamate synthase/dihydrofolate synthase [Pyrinomonadaceae bacterium]
MNFADATQYLLSLGHETLTMKLGLRNTELLLESLGNPQKSYESVQIAGTNGKGSTAVMLASICRAAGVVTGLYTSPHLTCITERINIGGQAISRERFARFATEAREAVKDLLAQRKIEALPTFFEHVTAIALLAFREADVEIAILETGLGGRLDATTVAGANTVGITSVSLDHQEYLGETVEEIAFEKAAIIRPGVTAIVAPQSSPVLEVILKRGRECDVRVTVAGCRVLKLSATPLGMFAATFESDEDLYEEVHLGLRGRHQVENAALAIQLAESLRRRGLAISKTAIVRGIERAEHEGRLTSLSGILLDGAHNPGAARALRDYLDEFVKEPLTLVFGAMNDKRLTEMAAILFPGVHQLILTQPDNPRAASVERLQTLAQNFIQSEKIIAAPRVSDALKKAREVTAPDDVICVTGSLYLVGEASTALVRSLQN